MNRTRSMIYLLIYVFLIFDITLHQDSKTTRWHQASNWNLATKAYSCNKRSKKTFVTLIKNDAN